MYLEELVENVQIENDKIECKARLNRGDVVGWLKTIAGFANASGGEFYIGVEDKTNKLIGFDRIEADNERNYFNNQVNELLSITPEELKRVANEYLNVDKFYIAIAGDEKQLKLYHK